MAKTTTNKVSPKKSQVGQKKSGNKKKNSKYPVLKFIGNAIAVLILLGVIFFFMVFFGILGPVPSKQQLHIINNPVASEVFSADGNSWPILCRKQK